MMHNLSLLHPTVAGALALVATAFLTAAETPAARSVAERRAAVFTAAEAGAAGLPALTQALEDENVLVRRAAVRALADLGAAAEAALTTATANSDALVRRAAIQTLAARGGPQALASLAAALKDPADDVRQMAATALVAIQPRSAEVMRLLNLARKDPAASVRAPAVQALWSFHRETVLFRNRPDVADMASKVRVALTVPLPDADWRFCTDPEENGELKAWFDPAFNDQGWELIPVGDFWQKAGFNYEGVAWYRRTFALPARPDLSAVEICFGAVDETAWVWINGTYVGQHDVGLAGWDDPFALDVTDALRWGTDNQITVRVQNVKAAGGIWKPVRIEVLKLDR
jgi:HEAT repeat protein